MSANAPVTVLLLSEEIEWRADLARHLKEAVYDVVVDDGDEALSGPDLPGDLVIIDLRLESRPPIDVCVDLRSRSSVPVLAVNEFGRDELASSAYDAGVDVVVTANIGNHELLSRLRALTRHRPAQSRLNNGSGAEPDGICLVPDTAEVAIGDLRMGLTAREYTTLALLIRHPGRVVPRGELTAGWRVRYPDRTLDSVIRRLREKLELLDAPQRIVVVRGVGFRLRSLRDLAP